MFRLIFCATLAGIWFIVTLPLAAIGLLLGLISKPIQYAIGRFITQTISMIVYRFNGARIHVTGQEHIPKDKTVLFVGNHRSLIDIPLLLSHSKKTIGFVGKDSLKKTPGINLWMVLIGSLFLNRTNVKEGVKTIKQGIAYLEAGHNLVVFPEGTRGSAQEMLPFKQGSMKLAEKSGALIVPFAIKGTGDMFEDNHYRFKKHPVYISFATPVDLSVLDREAKKNSAEAIQQTVQDMLNQMQ